VSGLCTRGLSAQAIRNSREYRVTLSWFVRSPSWTSVGCGGSGALELIVDTSGGLSVQQNKRRLVGRVDVALLGKDS